MSVDNFIPSIWAGSILRALDTALVYAGSGVVNRDYEGEIANGGDTVRINMIGDVSIQNYSKNTDIASPETLTDDQLILKIDQQKYANFQVDSVDQVQQRPKVMGEATRRTAYGIRKVIDSYVAGLYTDISTTNINQTNIGTTGSPLTGGWTTTGTLAYDKLVDLGVLLDNTDTPEEGRFVVVPPWFEGYLLKDQRFVGYGTLVQDRRLTEGSVGGTMQSPGAQPNNGGGPGAAPFGRAAGFDIYKSNNVPNTSGTVYRIIGGHPMAWSFAQQVTEIVAYSPEKRFADAMKLLVVYGAKVVRPANLAALTANPT